MKNKIGASLLVLVVGTFSSVGGCASDKSTLAKATAANDQLAPTIVTDADVAGYMQAIGNRIIASAKAYDAAGQGPSSHKKEKTDWMFTDQMQFHLVASNTVNAFTTGGQHMYVYSALLDLCDNENELAAVMSHEFAHVYCRHVQQGTNRQTGLQVFGYAAKGAGYVAGGTQNGSSYADSAGKAATSLGQFAGLSFTRKDEAEADKWGFQFYGKAGWDPDHFGDFFQKMIDAGYDTKSATNSDHPTLASRVAAAKNEDADWHTQYGPQAASMVQSPLKDPAAFAAFKIRAKQLASAVPDNQQTQQAKQLLSSFSSCVAPVDPPAHDAGK